MVMYRESYSLLNLLQLTNVPLSPDSPNRFKQVSTSVCRAASMPSECFLFAMRVYNHVSNFL